MDHVYIVTCSDLGWDNIVGVFKTLSDAEALSKPTPEDLAGDEGERYKAQVCEQTGIYDSYHIHCKEIK